MTCEEAAAEVQRLKRERPDCFYTAKEVAPGRWAVVGASVAAARPWQAETRAGPDVTPDPAEDRLGPVHGRRGF